MNPRELIDAWLDGEITPEQEAQLRGWLRQDPENVRTFVRETHAHRMLRDFAVSDQVQAEMKTTSPKPARKVSRGWWLAASVAACLLLAVGVVYLRRPAVDDSLAKVAAATSGATIKRGAQSLTASAGTALQADDVVQVATNASATITYADGTRIVVTADSDLALQPQNMPSVPEGAGKTALLIRGKIEADVAKQPVGKPLVLVTPNGTAVVLGTKLALTADKNTSRLDVSEGRVKFSRSSSAMSLEVSAGGYAMFDGAVTSSANAVVSGSAENVRILEDHEAGRLTWQHYPDTGFADFDVSTEQAHGGKRSLRVSYRSNPADADNYTELFHKLTLKPGDRALRFYLFVSSSDDSTGWNLQFRLRDRSCWMISDGDFKTLRPGWNMIELDLQQLPQRTFGESNYVPTEADGLLFTVCRGSATCFIDDLLIISGAAKP